VKRKSLTSSRNSSREFYQKLESCTYFTVGNTHRPLQTYKCNSVNGYEVKKEEITPPDPILFMEIRSFLCAWECDQRPQVTTRPGTFLTLSASVGIDYAL